MHSQNSGSIHQDLPDDHIVNICNAENLAECQKLCGVRLGNIAVPGTDRCKIHRVSKLMKKRCSYFAHSLQKRFFIFRWSYFTINTGRNAKISQLPICFICWKEKLIKRREFEEYLSEQIVI